MSILFTIIVFVAVLGVLVLVHELGHFFAAKRAGIRVEEFGIGFPPRLFGKIWRGTVYSINWLPLGGFVRIKGVADTPEQVEAKPTKPAPDSFSGKPRIVRLAVLSAGIFMNLVLAVVLFTIVFALGAPADVTELNDTHARIHDQQTIITAVVADSPAAATGLQAGDVLLELNQQPAPSVAAVQSASQVADQPISLVIERDGSQQTISVTPKQVSADTGDYVGIGIGLQAVGTVQYSLPWAFIRGVTYTGSVIAQIGLALKDLAVGAVHGEPVGDAVAGPIGIAVLTGEVARTGMIQLMQFAGLLSVNLALFNLFPIPALDGGRLLFVLIEIIRGKPVGQKAETLIHNIGFLVLIGLIVMVTAKDLIQLW